MGEAKLLIRSMLLLRQRNLDEAQTLLRNNSFVELQRESAYLQALICVLKEDSTTAMTMLTRITHAAGEAPPYWPAVFLEGGICAFLYH